MEMLPIYGDVINDIIMDVFGVTLRNIFYYEIKPYEYSFLFDR